MKYTTEQRAKDRESAREELRKNNPSLGDAEIEQALDDFDEMERFIHPERFGL